MREVPVEVVRREEVIKEVTLVERHETTLQELKREEVVKPVELIKEVLQEVKVTVEAPPVVKQVEVVKEVLVEVAVPAEIVKVPMVKIVQVRGESEG